MCLSAHMHDRHDPEMTKRGARSMAYTFYDIESLKNVFTAVTYTPKREGVPGSRATIAIYYVDDDDLIGQMAKRPLPPQFDKDGKPNEDYWSVDAMTIRYKNTKRPLNSEPSTKIIRRVLKRNPIMRDLNPVVVVFDLHTPDGAYAFMRQFLYRPDPANAHIRREVRYATTMLDGQRLTRTYVPETQVVSDTDERFQKNPDDYPYLLGYNSYNYDTTMLAYVFARMFDVTDDMGYDHGTGQRRATHPPIDLTDDDADRPFPGLSRTFTAREAREFNDELFENPDFRSSMPRALRDSTLCRKGDRRRSWQARQTKENTIRDRMLRTGRHLDVARLNEKQAKVGLKRLLGMMGHQILESDRLSSQTSQLKDFDELCELIAYNVSDVVYLAALFDDPVYKSQFEQKSNMLKAYPELVYKYEGDEVTFDKQPDGSRKARVNRGAVRPNRLYADSSSQQLASRSLCPESSLHDLPRVSLWYPHEMNTHARNPEVPENVDRRDILEEAHGFFMNEVLPRIERNDPAEARRARRDFTRVYNAYHAITRHNFDQGKVLQNENNAALAKLTQEVTTIYERSGSIPDTIVADVRKALESILERELPEAADDEGEQEKDPVQRIAREQEREAQQRRLEIEKRDAKRALVLVDFLDKDDIFNLQSEADKEDGIETALRQAFKAADLRQVVTSLPYNIFYYDGEGRRTSCFATFSTGGVHGAEFALAAYERDRKATDAYNANLAYLKSVFGDDDEGARALRASVKTATTPISKDDEGNELKFPDERKDHLVKEFLKNVTLAGATWQDKRKCDVFDQKPSGSNKLRPAYTWTSAAYVNHEDFSSYYPSLLRMMRVFYNEQLGYDRYGEIYADKERLGRLMKATSDPDTRYRLGLDRSGVKLILNTASGAGDAKFDNPVRMNNNIIAMRIIGQLFTWRIGQAQALHGAKVVSTNTDGLYTKLEREKNDRLLAVEADKIGVAIEPEPMYLISKDSNNRIEFDIVACEPEEAPIVGFAEDGSPIRATVDMRRGLTDKDGKAVPEGTPVRFKVLSVAGATLACREGPNPARSLAHPAATDWALSEYLMRIFARYGYRQSALEKPYDPKLGEQIISELHALKDATSDDDRVHGLMMFQNVIASNPNSYTYVYTNNLNPDQEEMLARFEWWDDESSNISPAGPAFYDDHGDVRTTQHYNRVFVMKPGTPNTKHVYDAVARVVPKPTIASRRRRGFTDTQLAQEMSASATKVMSEQGLAIADVKGAGEDLRDIISKKHSGIEPTWPMRIENADLWRLSADAVSEIYENLDLTIYQLLLEDVFENNWRNHL